MTNRRSTNVLQAAPARWGEFGLLVAASALGVGLWFGTRGAPPNRPGVVVDWSMTLVAADRGDLSCALPDQIGPAHCEFKRPDELWPAASGAVATDDLVLAPYSLTNGTRAIVAGVFTQHDVAVRAARDISLPRTRQKRFIAECRVRLLEKRFAVPVRFGESSPWGRADQAWIGVAEFCTTRD